MLMPKPRQRGSKKAYELNNALNAKKAQAASDGIKQVKRNRRSQTGVLLDASTASLMELLKKKNLDPIHRMAIQEELKCREQDMAKDEVPF